MFEKLLILSTSAGAGHIHAAKALESAIRGRNAARDLRHVDTLDYTNKLFQAIFRKLYIEIVQAAPDVWSWFYDVMDQSAENRQRRLLFEKLNTRPFVKMLQEYQPDLLICTHFLPAEIVSWLREEGKLDCPQAVVMTDFDLHSMWLCSHCEHYFVPLAETRAHLIALGVPADRVTVAGIPIEGQFTELPDKAELRAKLGLDPERATLLLSTGGYGLGPVERIIDGLLQLEHPAQVLAVAGRNEDLAEYLEALEAELPADANVKLHPFGYVNNMHELMAASDLLLGKPGGLTTSEALASGLVFVILNPLPGQEERNADHLLEEQAAIRCNNLPTLAWKIDRLLDHPERMEVLRGNALRLARPGAAEAIVDKLATLPAGQTLPPILRRRSKKRED